eukprot:COSAG05_NODE_1147_length_5730_cov_3.054520_7_plen_77_part_00
MLFWLGVVYGRCERFLELGQRHPKQACFIRCSSSCEDWAKQQAEAAAALEAARSSTGKSGKKKALGQKSPQVRTLH